MDNCFSRGDGGDGTPDSGGQGRRRSDDLDRGRHQGFERPGARGRKGGPRPRLRDTKTDPKPEALSQQPAEAVSGQSSEGVPEKCDFGFIDPRSQKSNTDDRVLRLASGRSEQTDEPDKSDNRADEAPERDSELVADVASPPANELRQVNERSAVLNYNVDELKDLRESDQRRPTPNLNEKTFVSKEKRGIDVPNWIDNKGRDGYLHRIGDGIEPVARLQESAREEEQRSGIYGVRAADTAFIKTLKGKELAQLFGVSTAKIKDLEEQFEIHDIPSRGLPSTIIEFKDKKINSEIAKIFNDAFGRKD